MKSKIIILLFISILKIQGQYKIEGRFEGLAGKSIQLNGFNSFINYEINTTTVSSNGTFELFYSANDFGMGYLIAEETTPYLIILSEEDIKLSGTDLSDFDQIKILNGIENKWFVKYATELSKHEQAKNAWVYLEKMYRGDTLFSSQKKTSALITKEINRLRKKENDFIDHLPKNSYVKWYIPKRKLINSINNLVHFKEEEIEIIIDSLRKIDYTDKRLYKSGLLKDCIESHFWLLENMGKPIDQVYDEMKISIDFLIKNLSSNENKLNEISNFLFDFLERRSLNKASEYLAIKLLTQNNCTINEDLANQLETYRKMKIGNTAPNIIFDGDVFKNGNAVKSLKQLTDIKSTYKVIFFGASWCPLCNDVITQLNSVYEKWEKKNIEVVNISLETNKEQFEKYTNKLKFISFSDYNKWNSNAAKDYYVFGTPTLFLLDTNNQIILRPNSIKQLDSWIDLYFTAK